jgi:hypothetical protein
MAFAVEEDEAPDPCQVALFGVVGVMFAAQDGAGAVEQLLIGCGFMVFPPCL